MRSLENDLRQGSVLYGNATLSCLLDRHTHRRLGVNTGFGGSANTRTQQVEGLQESLVAMLQCGTIYPSRESKISYAVNGAGQTSLSSFQRMRRGLLLEDPISTNCMPESWTRAAILIRINTLMRGASSVRPVIVYRLVDLLEYNIIPRIPIHGSISASGDLSPSSYLAGCIQGKSNISVLSGKERQMMPADVAMAEVKLDPVPFAAKEGLAIVNGTAFSAGVGALAIHDACGLVTLAQVLTAMSVEALGGSSESFHPYFAAVRAHPGQVRFPNAKIQALSFVGLTRFTL